MEAESRSSVVETPVIEGAPKKRAPTLYAIILFKLGKGALFLALGAWIYAMSDNDLPQEFQELLRFFRIQADTRFWVGMTEKLGRLTESEMLWFSGGLIGYSLFAWVEGIGMMFRAQWAGWMAIGESAFFIPLEIYELMERFTWRLSALLIINVAICWYLVKNRKRLFRHHFHP